MAAWKCLEDSQCLEGSQWLESKKSAGGREKWKYVHQQDRAGQGVRYPLRRCSPYGLLYTVRYLVLRHERGFTREGQLDPLESCGVGGRQEIPLSQATRVHSTHVSIPHPSCCVSQLDARCATLHLRQQTIRWKPQETTGTSRPRSPLIGHNGLIFH